MDRVPGTGGEAPGEQRLASVRDERLVLTDHRVVYRGRGIQKDVTHSIHVRNVTGISLRRGFVFRPILLSIPAVLFIATLLIAPMFPEYSYEEAQGSDLYRGNVYDFGMTFTMLTLPISFLVPGLIMRIAAPGDRLRMRIPRRDRSDAQAFIDRFGALRVKMDSASTQESPALPSTTPFGT